MNIRNVLVPVDFSLPATLAVNYAISLARQLRAKLTLVHVMQTEAFAHPFDVGPRATEEERRDEALRTLSALVAPEDQDDLDLQVVLKSGDIKKEIVSVIREKQADIVVMGTHGRGLLGRYVIGSITEGLLRHTSVPILTVCRATRPLSFKQILFATDFSDSAKDGLAFATELSRTLQSSLAVIHVVEDPPMSYGGPQGEYLGEQDTDTAKELARLVAEANPGELRIETIVAKGSAAEEILSAADQLGADLIVLTVRNKGIVERALLGTTAEHVVRKAHVPVLSVPADGAVAGDQLPKADSATSAGNRSPVGL